MKISLEVLIPKKIGQNKPRDTKSAENEASNACYRMIEKFLLLTEVGSLPVIGSAADCCWNLTFWLSIVEKLWDKTLLIINNNCWTGMTYNKKNDSYTN